jgi:hypothetical protein
MTTQARFVYDASIKGTLRGNNTANAVAAHFFAEGPFGGMSVLWE